jgi:hypothetical protein
MEEVEDGANSGWETGCEMRWRGPKAVSSEGGHCRGLAVGYVSAPYLN